MRRCTPSPNLIVPEPCQQSWDAMRDSGPARRHCDHCQSDVVDVSLLTGTELRSMVERTAGNFCARVTHLADGTLLLRETPAAVVSTASLLRAPVLAGAVLAGTAMSASAQSHARAAAPAFSCAEVTALKQPAAQIDLSAPAPAPALPLSGQSAAVTMGKPALPTVLLHGTLRLPNGRAVRNGIVYANLPRGESKPIQVGPDGSYSAALPPGKYSLRADVRADDAELYAAVDGVVLTGRTTTHDMKLEGPVAVTAGVPVYVPPPAKSGKR